MYIFINDKASYESSPLRITELTIRTMPCLKICLLQNIVSFIGLFCRRDLHFYRKRDDILQKTDLQTRNDALSGDLNALSEDLSFAEYRLFYRALLQKRLWGSEVSYSSDKSLYELSPLRITSPLSSWGADTSRQHIATHCNTLQHTATHCNTLQHLYQSLLLPSSSPPPLPPPPHPPLGAESMLV